MIGVLGAMADFAAANRQRFHQLDAGRWPAHHHLVRTMRAPLIS